MSRKKKRTYYWLIKSMRSSKFFGTSVVSARSKWPHLCTSLDLCISFPTCYQPLAFNTRDEALDWLFVKHTRKGRDVSHMKPIRIHANKLKKWYHV